MLQINNLTKVFKIDSNKSNDRLALDNISLNIEDGEFVTIIGGNGSGKTTLLNMIAGVYTPDHGSIYINGNNITKMPEHKRSRYIGRVFQDPTLGTVGEMSIEENFSLALKRGSVPKLVWSLKKSQRSFFKDEISKLNLGLENSLSTKVRLLSGGQRQALTLLMANLKKPDILLLDEHTAALDPKTSKIVLDLSEKMIHDNHLTALMITHNMKDAIRYGDRLIMMSNGRIILDVKGEEKKHLTVEMLIEKFSKSGEYNLPDNMFLS